jgi:uncharacterized protein (TIGR01244 family)
MFNSLLTLVLAGACFVSAFPQVVETSDKLDEIRAYRRISDQMATSGQIAYQQIPTIKAEGFEVVVNLAPADERRNGSEGFLVVKEGMSYVHIPVSWKDPSLRDLDLFFDVMEANKDRKVFVHCFANMRVSVFIYLYRTIQLGESEELARRDLRAIWDPAEQEQWVKFIEAARERQN